MEYDEDQELTRHVLSQHFEHLMSTRDRVLLDRILKRKKAVAYGKKIDEWDEEEPWVKVELADGLSAAERRLRDHLIADHAIIIARCSACARVLRTPKAQQCWWCGADWHPRQP
jgi:hypothetical protein